MDYSSEEESDISESEIDEYKDKPYEELKSGKYKVKVNGTLRCPFCFGKKKQDYKYKDLLQHASGVGKGSANRSAKQKANHVALAIYLENDLADEVDQSQRPVLPQPVNPIPQQDDVFVWPWMGIIVNIVMEPKDKEYWLKKFAQYKPLDVHTFRSDNEKTGQAVVKFNRDWIGFVNATEFEKSFETSHHGKKDWKERKTHPGSSIYGWCARADDHDFEGPMGEYLRREGKLRTISSIEEEAAESKKITVGNLANEIDQKNENLDEIQCKYNEKTMNLSRMLEEKDRLHNAFLEETRKMQRFARDNVRRILEEQENLNEELEAKKRKLDYWSKQLNKREALTERERQKLDEEKKKNDDKNNSLQLASMEQKKADENVLRLVEEQKREKEEALNKILQLEKQLDAKQKLEMEIEELKGKLLVMKHLGDEDDAAIQKKMKEMNDELEQKIEDLGDVESLNQTLIVKERQSNDELQEARKELIATMNMEDWETSSGEVSDTETNVKEANDDELQYAPGSLPKLQFRSDISKVRWNDEMAMAEVVEKKGKLWTTTGIVRSGKTYCSTEETLFLAELGGLVLMDDKDARLSLEDIYAKMEDEKNGCCRELYEVYRHLKSLGYVVGRRGVPWSLKGVKSNSLQITSESNRDITDTELNDASLIVERLSNLRKNELRLDFDVYLPNSKFRKSSPGDPAFRLCLIRSVQQ